MRRGWLLALAVGAAVFLSVGSAWAVSIDIVPASQDVLVGDTVDVEIAISGLGNLGVPSLGAFDIVLAFDPTVLTYQSAVFGDPLLGDELDVWDFGMNPMGVTSGAGTVNPWEVSLDFPIDLDTLQAGDFTLVTLSFAAAGPGTSTLTLWANALGDAAGAPLAADLGGGSVSVQSAVPEPTATLLFGIGSLVVALAVRRSSSV